LKFSNSKIIALLVYVDDFILIGNDISKINNITYLIGQALKIKKLGDLAYFLGFEVARNNKGIYLNKRN